MIWQGWVAIAIIGFIATYVALTTPEDDVLILFGIAGFLTWGLFALQSLNVTVVTDASIVQESYPAMSIWGLAMAVANGYAVLEGPIVLIDQRGKAEPEVTQ